MILLIILVIILFVFIPYENVVIKNGKVLLARHTYGDGKGKLIVPGGYAQYGETPQEALKREIREELETEIEVGEWIDTVEYDYPDFHLSMDCFLCTIKSGDLVLKEHEAAKWLSKDTLYSVEWLPADVELIGKLERLLK